jgi:hypothetical protein
MSLSVGVQFGSLGKQGLTGSTGSTGTIGPTGNIGYGNTGTITNLSFTGNYIYQNTTIQSCLSYPTALLSTPSTILVTPESTVGNIGNISIFNSSTTGFCYQVNDYLSNTYFNSIGFSGFPFISGCSPVILNNSNPAFAAVSSSKPLFFFNSTNINGDTGTWSSTIVDLFGRSNCSSTILTTNKPGISYLRNPSLGTSNLYFAYSSSIEGSTGTWNLVNVDNTANCGRFNSMTLLSNGNPCITYSDVTNTFLKFAYSSNSDGTGIWTKINVDNISVADGTSLKILSNGIPAIAYYTSTGDLKYAYASDNLGTSWNTLTIENVGNGNSLSLCVLNNGYPAISYSDSNTFTIKFAYSSNVLGTVWNIINLTPIVVTGIGRMSLILNKYKYPVILVYNGTVGIELFKSIDINGLNWNTQVIVKPLAENVDPQPGNTLINLSNGNLMYFYQSSLTLTLQRIGYFDLNYILF